jgi:thymidylate kinase
MLSVICFIGCDGTGKSTYSKNLADALIARNINVRHMHFSLFLPKICAGLLKKFRSQCAPSVSGIVTKAGENKFSRKERLITMLIYSVLIVDYFINYILFVRPLGKRRVNICDRYIYDFLVNSVKVVPLWYLRLCMNLIPEPNITFFLDAPSKIIFERKKEGDLSFYDYRIELYSKFVEKIKFKRLVRVNVDDTFEKINNIIFQEAWRLWEPTK